MSNILITLSTISFILNFWNFEETEDIVSFSFYFVYFYLYVNLWKLEFDKESAFHDSVSITLLNII